MPSRSEHIRDLARAIGPRAAAHVLGRRALKRASPVVVTAGSHAVSVRPLDSDMFVLGQIFGAREYDIGAGRVAALNLLASVWAQAGTQPVIVDAGANVGYSALFFEQTYPGAIVLALEPDAETFAQLSLNCRGHARIVPVHAALWSHDDGVSLQAEEAASWSRSVSDGGLTPSLTLESLLARIPAGRSLILKLDIEGAEREVCRASAGIVHEVPCIMVEPHDFKHPNAGSLAPLYSALAGRHVDTLIIGENLMIIDTALPPD